jgi:baseplate J-like protein
MTVTAAPPRRAVIDLGADATILDAAARLASIEGGHDVALVVPAGAPIVRNAVFLEVLRRRAADRRLVVVSADARARSLAASVHVPAFASLAALERHELDATEHLGEARRAALATIASVRPSGGGGFSIRRGLAVFLTLLLAAGILAAVVGPSATITVVPAATAVGPFEYDLRAGPSGDINDAQTKQDTVNKTFTAKATGSRSVDTNATGVEKFTNLTTNDIRIPRGTVLQTPDGIRFQTTEEKTLAKSLLSPIFLSTTNINIEAVDAGTKGNVGVDRINKGPSPDYSVTNPAPTTGGDSKKIAIVTQADYDAAVSTADGELQTAGDAQLTVWQGQTAKDRSVYGTLVRRTGITPATDVVGKEPDDGTFSLTVTGVAIGYVVSAAEPRNTALNRLAGEVSSDKQIDRGANAKVDIVLPATVDANGVHWRVSASSIQYARTDRTLTSALAGRTFDDATKIASDRGFKVIGIAPTPSWLPRLPLLDSRITIDVGEPTVTASSP